MSDKMIAKIGETFFEIERREDLYNWKIGNIYVWSVIRSRLFKILTRNSGVFNYATNRGIELTDEMRTYRGRYPMKLLAWAIVGMPKRPRKGEPDYRNLKRFKAVIVPFATRNEKLEDKFSKPVSDALGGDALNLGVGTWDKITAAPRIDDFNGWMIKYFGLVGRVVVRMILTKADYEKYRRVVAFLQS